MQIDLLLEKGEKQERFIEHLNALLRKAEVVRIALPQRSPDGTVTYHSSSTRGSSASASLEDGGLYSTIFEFRTIEGSITLEWTLQFSSDGTLRHLRVDSADPQHSDGAWQEEARQLVISALTGALGEKGMRFFGRVPFYYIGPNLDGEYWLPGFRFAPALPDDEKPRTVNYERVVFIDLNVDAIDREHAHLLATAAARTHSARLSFLLDLGLSRPSPSQFRWVGKERLPLGFRLGAETPDRMPEKSELCHLGKYEGVLDTPEESRSGLVSLPPEARKIFRGLARAKSSVRDAFDRCARLYQVALVLDPEFASAGLAYRIAAVEALSKSMDPPPGFQRFVRDHADLWPVEESVLDDLYGSVRSAHFHHGVFPVELLERTTVAQPLITPRSHYEGLLLTFGQSLTRKAIVGWLRLNILGISTPEHEW